jgi:hypothetical protein
MSKVLPPLLVIMSMAGCMSGLSSSIGLAELERDYQARFSVYEKTLYVDVENVPGLNLSSVESLSHDGKLFLAGNFISSGGRHHRRFTIDLSSMDLAPGWEGQTFWVEEGRWPSPFTARGIKSMATHRGPLPPEYKLSRIAVNRIERTTNGG